MALKKKKKKRKFILVLKPVSGRENGTTSADREACSASSQTAVGHGQ